MNVSSRGFSDIPSKQTFAIYYIQMHDSRLMCTLMLWQSIVTKAKEKKKKPYVGTLLTLRSRYWFAGLYTDLL